MSTVKLEPRADDEEINRLAASLVEQHRQKAAVAQQQQQQRVRAAGQASITSYFNSNSSGTPSAPDSGTVQKSSTVNDGARAVRSISSSHVVLDTDSARGRFGWSVIGGVAHPCIFRVNNERFCPVRSVEKFILNNYLQKLPMDVCNCTSIKSFFITENEAKLLNEINMRHCEHYFGREAFTSKDCIVRLSDAIQFAEFLALCERKMVNMQTRPDDRCGFLRINGESVVPFTVKSVRSGDEERNVRFVPLFYFEGETEHLKHKAQQLTGWDLAYLKLCCKVQGIRSELFQSDTCDVVSLNDVRRHFPVGTQFNTWWPPNKFEFKLTNQPKPSFWECQPPPSSSQVTPVVQRTGSVTTGPTQTASRPMPALTAVTTVASRTLQQQTAATSAAAAAAQAWATGRIVASMLASQQQQQRTNTVPQQLQQPRSQTSSGVPSAARPVVSTGAASQFFITNGQALASVNGHTRQSAAPSIPRVNPVASVLSEANWMAQQQQMLNQMRLSGTGSLPNFTNNASSMFSRQQSMPVTNASARTVASSQNVRQAPPLLPMATSKQVSQPVAIPGGDSSWSLDNSRLHQIPVSPLYNQRMAGHDPYQVQKLVLDGQEVHCINGRPYEHRQQYVSLHELVRVMFPKLSVRAFQDILVVLGVPVYRACDDQLLALGLNGSPLPPDRVVGLLRYTDLITFMPQIFYIYSSHSMVSQQQRQQHTVESSAKRLRTC